MKKIFLLPVLCMAFHLAQAQTVVSNVPNAGGDNGNFLFGNTSAANNTNDPRGVIWLDNDGKFKLRSVTGYGFAFRDVSNTWDMINIDNNGNMGIGIASGSQKLVMNGNMKLVLKGNFPAKNFC